MKVRTSHAKNVVLEMEPGDSGLPPVALPELALNKILVPVDFSDCSKAALHYAKLFTRQFQADLTLLHVVEPMPPQAMAMEMALPELEPQENAARQLAAWRNDLNVQGSKAVVRTGSAAHEIIRAADENNIDMVIMGTHGRKGLAHLLLGST
ncbi:MAG TPA: universal stress protein, partial [Clostridia bacterium]|nr:universal stress protein [Clostridia bacterium]